ncbi:hypothetical protein VPH35_106380 [Triticum aestivum]
MGEPADGFFLRLPPELVDEILLRLPPDEPACLVRASAVCKPWRRFFANANFRGRYREFHGAPPVLGLVQEAASFLAISALPTLPDLSHLVAAALKALDCRHGHLSHLVAAALKALDCRHGRYVFDSYDQYWQGDTVHLTVLDPLTGHGHHIPTPMDNRLLWYSVAVLCATQGCDHHDCQGGHFSVVIVTTNHEQRVTLGWLYSSETELWSALTSVSHPNVLKYSYIRGSPSVLVSDTLYFDLDGIIQCHLGSRCFSMLERPADGKGYLMTAEDGGLRFATMVDVTNLTLWSMQTGLEGAMGWAK